MEIYGLCEVEIRNSRCLAGDNTEATHTRLLHVTLKVGLILPTVCTEQTCPHLNPEIRYALLFEACATQDGSESPRAAMAMLSLPSSELLPTLKAHSLPDNHLQWAVLQGEWARWIVFPSVWNSVLNEVLNSKAPFIIACVHYKGLSHILEPETCPA